MRWLKRQFHNILAHCDVFYIQLIKENQGFRTGLFKKITIYNLAKMVGFDSIEIDSVL